MSQSNNHVIHNEHSANGRSNSAFTLQPDFLFETLLFGGSLGLRLQPVLDRFPFGGARLFPDFVSPLAYLLLVPPACHFILLSP